LTNGEDTARISAIFSLRFSTNICRTFTWQT